jgi:DNA mismatch endonuclease (patch repair protein)
MQANVGRVTAAERVLRSALREEGLRFKTDARPEPDLRCTADVVFPGAKVCLFIDGCFWHGCPRHFGLPKTNSAWWGEKIAANRARDARQSRLLRRRGWRVLRVWEHQMRPESVAQVVARATKLLRGPSPKKSASPAAAPRRASRRSR